MAIHINNMRIIFGLLLLAISSVSPGQVQELNFYSSDTALTTAFTHAKEMALSYRGDPKDPVGPWYEAALPSRNAFCMRDVSHQSLPAAMLGLGVENKNIFRHFVTNISASKDWCSYWEMNREGLPAPEDYRNDTAFWYNLNANADLIYASWKLYLWTGDSSYLTDPAFTDFRRRSLHDFIDRWILQPDSLLSRQAYPNAAIPFNIRDHFHRCRGLPSYSEGVPDLKMGADLVAALFRGMQTAAEMEALIGNSDLAKQYSAKASAYRDNLQQQWWDDQASLFHTHITNKHVFGKGEGETFLLWFDALTDTLKTRRTLEHLAAGKWNVENLSYLPAIFYRYGYNSEAYALMLLLANPATPRREYPEVSYGVIDGLVQGMMGAEADARHNRLSTVYRGSNEHNAVLEHLPVLSTRITIHHGKNQSTLENEGDRDITWRVAFNGRHRYIMVSGKKIKAQTQLGKLGNIISFTDLQVPAGKELAASIK